MMINWHYYLTDCNTAKYGYDTLNIRCPYPTDILRYTFIGHIPQVTSTGNGCTGL